MTRRSTSSVVGGVLAALLLAANASAAPPTWTSPKTIRAATDVQLGDADFAGHNVAIAWDEPGSPRKVGYATSEDNGAHFSVVPFPGAREPAVELCDGYQLNAADSRRVGPGNWIIEYTLLDSFDFSITTDVRPTDGLQHDPDIACTDGRIFVSWFEEESTGDRLFIAHATRDTGDFGTPIDLGFDSETDYVSGLVVAGVDNRAYAAFRRSGGDLRFRSWSIGPGPGFFVTANAEVIIGPGTSSSPAFQPVIAAAGDKVAVAWMTCDAVVARVSNDRGTTWGPIRTLVEHAVCDGDFGAAPNSIAIRGSRIAVEYSTAGIVGDGDENLIRTTNNFASFSDAQISGVGRFSDQVGYLTVGGHVRLAEAFDAGNKIKFRRQT